MAYLRALEILIGIIPKKNDTKPRTTIAIHLAAVGSISSDRLGNESLCKEASKIAAE